MVLDKGAGEASANGRAGTDGHRPRIGFVAIAEPHQLFHCLGAALRLARQSRAQVDLLHVGGLGLDLARRYDPNSELGYVALRRPIAARPGDLCATPPRAITLLANLDHFARYDCLVTTERTSTLLRWLGPARPGLIHIPHGAGDRARGYDRRLRHFDLILAAGEKDRRRFVERGLITPERCVVTGYAKPELVAGRARPLTPGRTTVLYNPHFDPQLSSWIGRQEQILQMIAGAPDLDFVLAPHIRLHPRHRIADPGLPNLRIDWGSLASIDMTYVNGADIYLGDVSSQVYEFILTPRPCVFLNLQGVKWQNDGHFRHWLFGEVVTEVVTLPAALRAAPARHADFVDEQRRGLAESLDASPVPPSLRQARAIADFLDLRLADGDEGWL